MKAKNLRILAKLQSKSGQDESCLFARLDLIKDAYEVFGYGLPKIIKALEDDGAEEGLSRSNVQGFIARAKKKGLIGKKGYRKDELKELDFDVSTSKGENTVIPLVQNPESAISTDNGEDKVPEVVLSEIDLPKTGPVDEETWRAFAKRKGYPLDRSGNIDVDAYADILGPDGVEMLEDADFEHLAGLLKTWRDHPDRNISESWRVGVAGRATKLKVEIRRAAGLKKTN